MRFLTILTILVCLGSALQADVMLFDRGLPTTNLNNTAGTDRSNVAWGDYSPYQNQSPPYQTLNWAIGDDFNLNLPGTYDITDLRVWIVSTGNQSPAAMWNDLRLFGGPTSGAPGSIVQLSQVSTNGSDPNVIMKQVQYANGDNYQGSSGGFISLWQVDFLVNWAVNGNTTYSFFVGDTPTALNQSLYPPGVSPFLSASNAALSGSTQQGADNLLHDIGWDASGVQVYETWSSADPGGGWDKASDVNVQLEGTPEPTSIILLGTVAFFVSSVIRRRHQGR